VRLWAISDLHVGFEANRAAVEAMGDHGDDWLILAGDTGDTLAQLTLALDVVTRRFARVIWTPGNHDLWTPRQWPDSRRGEAHSRASSTPAVSARCRHAGGSVRGLAGYRPRHRALLHLYDYSFGPAFARRGRGVGDQTKVQCADELLLAPARTPRAPTGARRGSRPRRPTSTLSRRGRER
jgi:3',5'-cyclic AMP phosphodiesterase CpdA